MQSAVERVVFIDVVSFDWSCPKYSTPGYSIEEVEELAGPLRKRIAELEMEVRAARTGSSTARHNGNGSDCVPSYVGEENA